MSFETVGAGVGIHALLNGTITAHTLVGYWIGYHFLNLATYYFTYAWNMAATYVYPRFVQQLEITAMGSKHDKIIDNVLALFAKNNPLSFDKEYVVNKDINLDFNIAPGYYTLKYNGWWVRLSYSVSQGSNLSPKTRYLRVWTLSTDRKFFDSLVPQSEKIAREICNLYTFSPGGGYLSHASMVDTPTNWARKGPIPARKWKNVIISSENHKLLNDAFSRYLNRSQKEIDMEIPHKLCIVLSGPPGFGKTSLIKAIAHEYQLNLYVGALSQMNDSQISGIADSMLPKSALVFEDVDCMAGRESDDPEVAGVKGLMAAMGRSSSGPKVTLSAMLNMLDGLTTLGNIVIMTTNRPEKLDEALLRSERVDVHLRLGPDPEVYSNMLIRFYPEAQLSAGVVADFANRCMDKRLSTADLQAHFRANINDVEAGLRL